MTRYVRPSHTVQLTGTLAQGQELVALYGYATAPAGAVLQVNGAFTNDGRIVVDGTFNTNYGGYQGTAATLNNAGTLTNNGIIDITGPTPGSFFGPADTTVPPPEGGMLVNDGVLLNNGTIYLGGQPFTQEYFGYLSGEDVPAILQDNGYLHNAGSIYVAGFAVGYYNFSGTSPGQLNVAGTFVNDGTLTEGFGFYGKYGAGATVDVSGTLINNVDGLISGNRSSNDGPLLDIAAGGTLANAGMLVASYSDNTGMTIDDGGLLTNSGTLQLDGGGGGYDDGRVGGGMLDVTGVLTNSGHLLVNVRPSNKDYNHGPSGATLDNAGTLTNTGSLMVYGAMVSSYDVQSPGGALFDSGTLTNAAQGLLSLTGGATGYVGAGGAIFDVTGVFDNNGLTRVGAGGAEGAVLTDDGLIRNHGTIVVQGSTLAAAGVLIDAGRLINDGLLSINAGSGAAPQGLTISAGGTLNDAGTINGTGTLVNDGFIGSGGSGDTAGLITVATLVNDGIITIAPHSALNIESNTPFGATGTYDIQDDATLTLGGTVEFYQTVDFAGNSGTLAIGRAFNFFATLDLAQPHATIDFLTRDVTSAIASGTTLEIGFANGYTENYRLTAPVLPGTTIGLRSDGDGGTDVIFHPGATGI